MVRVFLHCLNAAWRRWAGGEQHVCLQSSRRTQLLRMVLDKNKTSAACISVHVWYFWEVNKSSVLLWGFLLEASLAAVKHKDDSCG